MHILYASDENYIRHLAASLMSVMDACRGETELVFHVMSTGISDESKEKVQKLVSKRRRSITFYELGDLSTWVDFSFNTRGFAVSALTRLFLGRVLPEDVHRILYLDCDTVVVAPLSALWETDMGNCPIGMVAEPTVSKKRRKSLGLPEEQPYYNSGVILFNMDLWRQQEVERLVLGYYASKNGDLLAPDQDALNGALQHRIYQLSPRYNYSGIQIYYSWKALQKICKPTPYFSKQDYIAEVEHPAIIHFLGEQRPWRAGNRHPYEGAYLRYAGLTPWGTIPQEEGWRLYFRAFRLFNLLMKPFPYLRWKIIDGLIPLFMKYREHARNRRK